MKRELLLIGAITFAVSISPVFAQEQNSENTQSEGVEEQQNPVIEDNSIPGVRYEFDENGEFARIRSVGEAELEFGDSKDIRIAKQKAMMRAKANIAKFLKERITTEEVMDEIEKRLSKSNNGNKQVSRETISTYTEKMQNSAEKILRGVIVTQVIVDKNEKTVKVEVGYSRKTQAAASFVDKSLSESNQTQNKNTTIEPKKSNKKNISIKRAKNYDDF